MALTLSDLISLKSVEKLSMQINYAYNNLKRF